MQHAGRVRSGATVFGTFSCAKPGVLLKRTVLLQAPLKHQIRRNAKPLAAPVSAVVDSQAHAAQTLTDVPVNVILELAELDSKTAGAISGILKPALTVASVLMIVRIVMSWYPEIDGKNLPWSIAYTPTEPILEATRKVVKPFNGLDVSPIVWVALLSFFSEILTGPQGILSLIERKGI